MNIFNLTKSFQLYFRMPLQDPDMTLVRMKFIFVYVKTIREIITKPIILFMKWFIVFYAVL